MSTFWRSKHQKKRPRRSIRSAEQTQLQVQHLEARQMLSGESVVENSPPIVGTSLYHVVVNSDAQPQLIELENLFVDPDGDEITISIDSNTDAGIVTPYLQGEQLLLEFSGVVGATTITIRGTDPSGESVLSAFHVDVRDSESSISATVSGTTSTKPVGTVQSELSPPEVLNEWEPAALEVWYTVGADTPTEPFDFGLRFQALASYFEQPTALATLGSHMNIQHDTIDQRHSTYAYIHDLDLSAYQSGDRVLIASYLYAPAVGSPGNISMERSGDFPAVSYDSVFEVTQAVFIGEKLAVSERYVSSQMAPVVYDANDDGRIGLADFARFISNYGKSNDGLQPTDDQSSVQFDYNRDGKVGIADFAAFIRSYGKGIGGSVDFDMPGLTTPLHSSEAVDAPSNRELPISAAVDHVFDHANRTLYVVSVGGHLERWDYANQTLLERYDNVAVSPSSIEIVPGGQFAIIGDATADNGSGVVWLVDLSTGAKQRWTFLLEGSETGVQDVATSADGKIFVTSQTYSTGGGNIRMIDYDTDVITKISRVPKRSGIARNADHSLIVFQSGIASGDEIVNYDSNIGDFVEIPNEYRYFDATRSAVSQRDGKLFLRNTLLSGDWNRERIGPHFLHSPVFDNQRPLLYGALPETDEVIVYDAGSLEVLRRIHIGADITTDVKMSLSDDSQHLFILTTSGIRQVATNISEANLDDIQNPAGHILANDPGNAPRWMTIQFDEPVSGLTIDDLQLTRDRGDDLLTGSEKLFSINRGRTWILLGVADLMTEAGSYSLHLSAAGSQISDSGGNQLPSDLYQVWTNVDPADNVPLPMGGVHDQVYDEASGILYITTEDGSLHRWDVAQQRFLKRIENVAAIPAGLDTSPDGRFVYVGEGLIGINKGLVYKIDLQSGAKTTYQFDNDFSNYAVHDLAVSADERVFFTVFFAGSGNVGVGKIDGEAVSISPQRYLYTDSIITRTLDRSTLYFYRSDKTSVPELIYDTDQGVFQQNPNNTMWPGTAAYEISSPSQNIYYFVDFDTDEIIVFDQDTDNQIGGFAIGENVARDTYESGFQLAINSDGSLIFLVNQGRVRQVPIPAMTQQRFTRTDPPVGIDDQDYTNYVDDLFNQADDFELELPLD